MIAALVLAGGEGRRLGGVDKAFIELSGRPLIAHVLGRLAGQAKKIAISANGDPARFGAFPYPVLNDAGFAGRGPLAGLAAGLAWAEGQQVEALCTVPVDTPFIPRDLVRRLAPAPSVAMYRGRQHHLAALWPVSCRAALERFLVSDGSFKVRDFLRQLGARHVDFAAPLDPFFNLNTPEDWTAALARLESLPKAAQLGEE